MAISRIDYSGKKVAILGYGLEGESAYKYFLERGADITIVDENESTSRPLPSGVKTILGEGAIDSLAKFDLVSRTPPFRPDKVPDGPDVTSLTKEFFKSCPAPIIGITGTKGKGTTSTLITSILRQAGKSIHLVGNIGSPALEVLNEIKEDDIVVYEMSSFQLWDMNVSPHVAVVLMMSEDHMDVHGNMEEYIQAKSQIVNHQKPEDLAVVHPSNEFSAKAAANAGGRVVHFLTDEAANVEGNAITIDGQEICKTSEVGLLGAHNLENITAAISAAWEYTRDTSAIKKAVTEFKGLEHRLEFVTETNGVKFYNDSYSSVPTACMAALKSFESPIILIAGGSEKHVDYSGLVEAISDNANVKHVLLIGQTGAGLGEKLKATGFDSFDVLDEKDMNKIVKEAASVAQSGYIVLLSPAFASFDMFKNFKDRGEKFKEAVQNLES